MYNYYMADFNPVKYKFLDPFFDIDRQLEFFSKCGYSPGKGQRKVHEDLTRKRFIAFSAAARFGKSLLLGAICAYGLMYPDYRIWLVGPKYDQCNREFQWVEDLLTELRLPDGRRMIDLFHVSKPRKGQRSITSKFWGSSLETKSAEGGSGNKDDLLGASLDLVGICEGSRVSIEAWTRYLYPRLGDRQGQAILPSTACEDSGLLVFFQEKGLDFQKIEWSFHHFTLYDAAHFSKEEIEKARRDLPDKDFREQYLSEALSRKDKVFAFLREHRCSLEELPPTLYSLPMIIGMKGNQNNPYVFFLIAYDSRESTYYVIQEFSKKHTSTEEVGTKALEACTGKHVMCVVGDSHDPEFSKEQIEFFYGKLQYSDNFQEKSKGKGEALMAKINTIQEVLSVKEGKIRLKIWEEKCPYLVEALNKMTWPEDREQSQRANMEKPLDLYTPAINALANALIFVENTRV